MTVRCQIAAFAAVLALLGGVGCSDRSREPLPAETDEPFYVQGKQLMKQGRNPEALTAFLKVIDRRGEAGAAESHLEAGHIYLHYMKDPVDAYHHFRKYLSLQPNSKESAGVRGKVEDALREFARTLPARPLEDQSAKLEVRETFEKLQRENEELRAQLATLRGGAQSARSAPMITVPDDPQSRAAPVMPVTSAPDATVSAAPPRPAPPANPLVSVPTPLPQTQSKSTPTTRPTSPPAGRTHVVQPKEGLYGISVKYYGNGKQVKAIYQANRDIMKSESDLRPGMVLKIPQLDAPAPQKK
jgi:hypothetical protein